MISLPTRHVRIAVQGTVFALWISLILATHHPMDSWIAQHVPVSLLLRIDPLVLTVVCGGLRMGVTILLLGAVTLAVSLLLGRVFCGWESWNTLDSALNDLGASKWEIETPLYGSLSSIEHHATTWPMAIILVNRTADMAMEVRRQIAKLEYEIAEIGEKFGMSNRAKELQGILDNLIDETLSSQMTEEPITK